MRVGLRRLRSPQQFVWMAFCAMACGASGDPPPDADIGVTPDADVALAVLAPDIGWLEAGEPMIAPPSLTPCPTGWREVFLDGVDADVGVASCQPYPESGPEACPGGSTHFVGEPGCAPVGAPCPAGVFPVGLPSDQPVLYVLSGAAPGGDGSRGAPLPSIAAATGLASSGTVIALGKGEYDEPVRLGAGVTLWGACATETHVTVSSPSSGAAAVVELLGADAQLHNLYLGPADIPGLIVSGAGVSVFVDGLLIEGTRSAGIVVVAGGRVHGRTVRVSNTRARRDGIGGAAILAHTAGTAELTRVVFSGNRGQGVYATHEGTSITLSDLVIRDTGSWVLDRTFGRGLHVVDGATAEISRALFARNRDVGVFVDGEGASVTLSDVVVRDTQARESDGAGGRGLTVQRGATAEVRRALFARNRELALSVGGAGAVVTASDVVIRDTEARSSDGRGGRGLNVHAGATVEVSRALFVHNGDVGVFAEGVGTSVTLADLVVRDTESQEHDGESGRGLSVQDGAVVEVSRALFAHNHDVGVQVSDEGTVVTLSNVVVRDTQGRQLDGAFGRGLGAQDGATVRVDRTLLAHNRDVGVQVSDEGTSVTLSDIVVRDTEGQESDGTGGRGLGVQYGPTVEVSRAVFARNREFGVVALGPRTALSLMDIAVTETAEGLCAAMGCESSFGVGVATVSLAEVVTTRFVVSGSALCGAFLTLDGELDLSEGEVSRSPVGVCLQVEGYAVPRLTRGVRYVDNDTNLDATSLPVPEVGRRLGGP